MAQNPLRSGPFQGVYSSVRSFSLTLGLAAIVVPSLHPLSAAENTLSGNPLATSVMAANFDEVARQGMAILTVGAPGIHSSNVIPVCVSNSVVFKGRNWLKVVGIAAFAVPALVMQKRSIDRPVEHFVDHPVNPQGFAVYVNRSVFLLTNGRWVVPASAGVVDLYPTEYPLRGCHSVPFSHMGIMAANELGVKGISQWQ